MEADISTLQRTGHFYFALTEIATERKRRTYHAARKGGAICPTR